MSVLQGFLLTQEVGTCTKEAETRQSATTDRTKHGEGLGLPVEVERPLLGARRGNHRVCSGQPVLIPHFRE